VKIEFLLRDEPPNPFEPEKRGMPFVHMENLGLDSERVQGVYPTDAEHNFLAHSHFQVASVKLGGDETIFGVVFRDIGIEQIKADTADTQLPDLGINIAVENFYRDKQGTIVASDIANRQVMKILIEIDRALDAVLVDFLPEISVPIEQTDGDEV